MTSVKKRTAGFTILFLQVLIIRFNLPAYAHIGADGNVLMDWH